MRYLCNPTILYEPDAKHDIPV